VQRGGVIDEEEKEVFLQLAFRFGGRRTFDFQYWSITSSHLVENPLQKHVQVYPSPNGRVVARLQAQSFFFLIFVVSASA
jgi:hypothetical protein